MRRLFLCALAFMIATLLPATFMSSQAATEASSAQGALADEERPYRVVGYFTQWGKYGRNYHVKDIHTSGAAEKLTHINYAFGNVSTDYRCYMETRLGWGDATADFESSYSAADSVDGVADVPGQPIKGHFNQLKKLKTMYPHLKVLISLGGWSWSGRFSDAAMPEHREAFVKSCIDLYIRGNLPIWAFVSGGTPSAGLSNGRAYGVFDGIDVDWEYPASEGFPGDPKRGLPPNIYRPEDTENFVALMAEFRRQLDEVGKEHGKDYLLTIAAPPDRKRAAKMALDQAHPYLDFINIMAYDMAGAWARTGPTNFHAPLYASPDAPQTEDSPLSVDAAVNDFLGWGIPPNKIVVGVPFYGRGWTNVPNVANGLYQSDPAMRAAPAKWEDGIEDYKILAASGAPTFRDEKSGAMWSYDGKTFWTYDDAQTLLAKMAYIRARGLGGAMIWSLDGDDRQGTLITAVFEGLMR
ncbi:MAG: glycoside hydrolase family 18 protein [Anaerolineae bacterium]